MTRRVGFLGALTVLSCACSIVNYGPPLQETTLPPSDTHRENDILSFSYHPSTSSGHKDKNQTLSASGQRVKYFLEKDTSFKSVVFSQIPPVRGVHVNLYETDGPPPSALCAASIWTFGLVPCYVEGVLYEVRLDVLADNAVLKTYSGTVTRTGANWIGFLPFFWINFLVNTGHGEAFDSTVHNLISAARSDNLL